RIAAAASAAGRRMIDAPVSGSREPAARGELVILAGGDPSDRPLAEPLVAAMGRRTGCAGGVGGRPRRQLRGPVGALSPPRAPAETIAVAEVSGLDPALFLDAIAGGPIDLAYAHLKGAAMKDRDFTPAFPLSLAAKDAHLVRDLIGDGSEQLAPFLDVVVDRA